MSSCTSGAVCTAPRILGCQERFGKKKQRAMTLGSWRSDSWVAMSQGPAKDLPKGLWKAGKSTEGCTHLQGKFQKPDPLVC